MRLGMKEAGGRESGCVSMWRRGRESVCVLERERER